MGNKVPSEIVSLKLGRGGSLLKLNEDGFIYVLV